MVEPPVKPPPELIDLPDVPLQIIADNLGLFGVINLRKVCRRFRNLLENHPPSVDLGQVTIIINSDVLQVTHGREEESFHITYKKTSNGCTVTSNKPNRNGQIVTIDLPNEEYKTTFFADLEKNLKLQKTLLRKLKIADQICEDTSFLEKFSSILRARKQQLKVTLLYMKVSKLGDVQFILPHLDSRSLEGICFERGFPNSQKVTAAEMKQISNLEQWKRAKKIGIFSTFVAKDIYHYCSHAEYIWFNNQTGDFQFDDLLACREKIIKCDFKEIKFEYRNSKDEQQVLDMMGPHFNKIESSGSFERNKKQWIFNAPNRKVIIVDLQQGELVIRCKDFDDIAHYGVLVFQPMFTFPEYNVIQID